MSGSDCGEAAPPPLAMAHIWPRVHRMRVPDASDGLSWPFKTDLAGRSQDKAVIETYNDARMCRVKMPADADQPRGKRGVVLAFSRASRKRLLETLHKVHQEAEQPLFVTLTFPDLFPSLEEARAMLRAWCKRVSRRWKTAAVVWRLETIDRKSGASKGQVAPHFHTLVFGVPDGARAELQRMWWEVNEPEGAHYAAARCWTAAELREIAQGDLWEIGVTSRDLDHLEHGCDAQRIRSWQGVVSYCGKYMAKDSHHEVAGRVWGIHARRCMPMQHRPRRLLVSKKVGHRVRRCVRRLMRSRGASRKGEWASTVFTLRPEFAEVIAVYFGRDET